MQSVLRSCVLALLFVLSPAMARDYVVALNGNDQSGNGTVEKPFATIGKGLAQAQPGDRVLLRAGDYRVAEHQADQKGKALKFPRAGESGKPITLAAYKNEYVALLGSVRLTGWQKHSGKIWKCKRPKRLVQGLYEDSERLTHPRWPGRRKNPDVSMLQWPGTWTQDKDWVYLWAREGDSPDNHRIEASQHWVVNINKPWIRLENLRVFFGQNVNVVIWADHVEVVNCEIAHCSNSVDNSYNAYFWGCSNSAFRNCVIHDSFYWGDHGSNSHVVSSIDCGDKGPNFVDGCEIFNGGLGVGTKSAVRELVIMNSDIYDVVNGVLISGKRSSGPGAGKTDRGHYLIWNNRIHDCSRAVWFGSKGTNGNRIWGNLIENCFNGIGMRAYGVPKDTHIANNIIRGCGSGIEAVAGRKGKPTLHVFLSEGLKSHNNLFHGNKAIWRNPLTWGKNLDLDCAALQQGKGLQSPEGKAGALEQESFSADPKTDVFGRAMEDSPTIGKGAKLPLPSYMPQQDSWHIGLGPWKRKEVKPELGLTLDLAGSAPSVSPGGVVKLKATFTNEFSEKDVTFSGDQDVILTFHFRYTSWHMDKQELWRMRLRLPEKALKPGETLDLTTLPDWKNPTNGTAGSAFHLRTKGPYKDAPKHFRSSWAGSGCRLRATARFVKRTDKTTDALQRLEPLLRSKGILRVRVSH